MEDILKQFNQLNRSEQKELIKTLKANKKQVDFTLIGREPNEELITW